MLHKPHKPTVHEHGITGYEKTDVAGKPLFWNFAILTVTLIVCIIVALWVYLQGERTASRHSVPVLPVAEERNLPPLPRLQERPALDIEALREREKAQTTEYKWIDPVAGIVQIPVDRAMEIVAKQGLPYGAEAHVSSQTSAPGAATAAPVSPAPAPAPAPAETVEPAPAELPAQETQAEATTL